MPNLDETPPTCHYECVGGFFELIGATNVPEGMHCPSRIGQCSTIGETQDTPPEPIEDEPIPDPPINSAFASQDLLNGGIYTFNNRSSKLYLSQGKADKGYGFFPSLTLDQLAAYYPSIAEDVSALLAVRSLASFKVTLPALPASVVARRDD